MYCSCNSVRPHLSLAAPKQGGQFAPASVACQRVGIEFGKNRAGVYDRTACMHARTTSAMSSLVMVKTQMSRVLRADAR